MRSDIEALRADMRLPTHSKVWQPRNLSTEYGWDRNFVVMGSKNNGQVHRSYREYFDRPIQYDVRGYQYSVKPDVMRIYESRPQSMGKNFRKKFFQSISEWKNRPGEDRKQHTHTLFPTFPENNAQIPFLRTTTTTKRSPKNRAPPQQRWDKQVSFPPAQANRGGYS